MGSVLINTSLSSIFTSMLSLEVFHQNCQAALDLCEINEIWNLRIGGSLHMFDFTGKICQNDEMLEKSGDHF